MERFGYREAARQMFGFRPDDAYSLDAVTNQFRRWKAELRRYEKGEVCLRSGEPATQMLFVCSGVLHRQMLTDLGDAVLLGVDTPGTYVGLSQIYDPQPTYSVDVVAHTEAAVVVFDVDPIREWRYRTKKSLPLFNYMGNQLCSNLYDAEARIMILSGMTIIERVRRYLVVNMKLQNSNEVALPGSEMDLAEYLGVNHCALSRVFSQLKSSGKISVRRSVITVLDLDFTNVGKLN